MRILSIGENCLVNYYLKALNLSKENELFDNCRSNIEYITQIIGNYSTLLDKQYLKLQIVETKRLVTKNILYKSLNNIYCKYHMDGYEFTHHNLLENKEHYESFLRKLIRFKNIMSTENILFVYNYKYCENNNIEILITLIRNFLKKVKSLQYKLNYKICIIYQKNIFVKDSFYKLELIEPNIYLASFDSIEPWINDNWNGLSDEHIIKKMFLELVRIN